MSGVQPILDLPPVTDPSDLSWLPEPEQLVTAIEVAHDKWPKVWCSAFDNLGVNSASLCPTLSSAHVALRGINSGAHFYHHELRGHIPLPDSLHPSQRVWENEQSIPIWRDGILHAPKYFSFFLESALPPYHPNHRSKWRTHEMLHTSIGFFWNPQITRFEAYVGARLSELLPVVHWYGLDEIGRLRCPKHKGQKIYRTHCLVCESLVAPFWQTKEDNGKNHDDAVKHAAHTLSHFTTEFKACLNEIETGLPVATPRPNLDASSDAQGYVIGHWNRITSWSFGSWVLQFCVDGVDYHSSLSNFARHVAECFREMLCGCTHNSPIESERLRLRQSVLDIGYRAYCALEWLQDESSEALLLGCLEDLAKTAHGLLDGSAEPSEAVMAIEMMDAAMSGIDGLLPEGVVKRYLAHGHVSRNREEAGERGFDFVVEGLLDGLPDILSQIEGWESTVMDFIRSDAFMLPQSLRVRFALWLKKSKAFPPDISGAIQIEAWLRDVPHKDETAELFASMPTREDWGPGTLRSHETLRRKIFPSAAVQLLFGWDVIEESLKLCCLWTDGSPQVFVETEAMGVIFQAVENGETPEQDETVLDLLDIGALVWLPKPRSNQ